MNKADFYTSLEDLFEEDEGSIGDESVLKELEGWDSMTFVGLIALVDEEFGVTLSPTDVLSCATTVDLVNLLGSLITVE